MSNNCILNFKNITVIQWGQIVFPQLNFTINKGEHYAIIGASGSGKTTLINAISGKLSVIGGEANYPLLDEIVKERSTVDAFYTRQRLIATINAKHSFTNLSNTNNFYYQQRFNSSDSEDAQTVGEYLTTINAYANKGFWTIDRLVGRFNLQALKNKQLIKLSNGETKRLLFAAALIKNPVLLLLDDPFTGLDKATRNDFDNLIQEISASGITILMASSATNEIPETISKIAVLENNTLSTIYSREAFDAKKINFDTDISIDTNTLQQLISVKAHKQYNSIVKMKNIFIRYGEKIILDNIDWEIMQGERWALLGDNGAGKSTLLSLINADNPQAYANDIFLFDIKRGSGETIWEIKNKTGFISPELFQYFPVENSCLEVIISGLYDTIGLFRQPTTANINLAKQWMQLLQIEKSEKTTFKNVSTSVQRLCLLARALIKNPPLLIFDEPCQNLDAQQKKYFNSLIDKICTITNTTVIYVSHHIEEMPACITKTLKLCNGKVVSN
jgi:molybdate transport system ATP-binding protein